MDFARYLAPTAAFGGNSGKLNVEQWRCVYTLRGHTGGKYSVLCHKITGHLQSYLCDVDQNKVSLFKWYQTTDN